MFLASLPASETAEKMAQHASEAAHGAAEAAHHAAASGHEGGVPHAVNWVNLWAHSIHNPELSAWLLKWESAIFAGMVVLIISVFCILASGRAKLIPGRAQAMVELIVEGLDNLTCNVMGPKGRAYSPYIGALFLYILVNNWLGLVPLQNSATAFLTTTAPLALCTFFYTQFTGIAKNGIFGYFFHLMGSPKSVPEWALVPLMMPLHVMGEFIKPMSLMFRLYGNVMAGHILVAVFLQLGLGLLKPLHIPVGVPLHLPFLFMEIMVGAIQALVFSLLSAVYIAMMLPHDHHEHEEHHGAHPAKAHAH